MSLDYLERYLWEAEAHANELLDLVSGDDLDLLEEFLAANWEATLPALMRPTRQTAFVFLGEAPTARERRKAKMEYGAFQLLWLQARFHALQSTKAMRLALAAGSVRGWGYRKAVRHMAEAALPLQDLPEPEDLLWLKFPC